MENPEEEFQEEEEEEFQEEERGNVREGRFYATASVKSDFGSGSQHEQPTKYWSEAVFPFMITSSILGLALFKHIPPPFSA